MAPLRCHEHPSRGLRLGRLGHMILVGNCRFLGLHRLLAHRRLVDLVVGVDIGRKRHAGGVSQCGSGIVSDNSNLLCLEHNDHTYSLHLRRM